MDKNQVTMIAVGAGIVGLLVGMAVTSLGDAGRGGNREKHEDKMGMMEHRDDEMGMDHSGMAMESNRVESEREFITEMIPHHEEAIKSAQEVLVRGGTTPEIRALAQNIITTQQVEVDSMKAMFKDWYGADYKPEGNYEAMMRDVRSLSGVELDKAFLTDMIMHHEMAITMSNDVTPHLVHEELKTLSTNIKTTQTTELETMKKLLETLN
ncbi:MAG: DUF305 domain-containing protein [Patescibacteria group bacterium]